MKTEVYSWRLSSEKKVALEAEARKERKSVSQLLEDISSQWLEDKRLSTPVQTAEQEKTRKQVLRLAGALAGGDPDRATKASARLKDIIANRHGRSPR